MTNDDHTGTSTPPHAAEWVPPSGAPPIPQPDGSKPRARKRGMTVLLVVLLTAVVMTAVFGINWLTSSPSTPGPQRSYTSMPTAGYSGDAVSTGSISPAWASGIETAWRLPLNPEDKNATVFLYAEGSTLYVTFQSVLGPSRTFTAQAYDLSGTEPRLLWDEKKQKSPFIDTSTFVVTDTDIVFNSVIIHKATGRLSHTPWKDMKPVALADDVLVACDEDVACDGWERGASDWTQKWTSRTAPHNFTNLNQDQITYPVSRVITNGETTRVLLPINTDQHPAQLIDPLTGVVTNLEDPASYNPEEPRDLLIAQDGVVAYDDYTALTFDAGGFLVGLQPASTGGRMTTNDGTAPSVADIQEFFSGSAPTWATATAKEVNRAKGEQCPILTVTPTDGSPSRSVCPNDNNLNHTYVAYSPSDIRVSPGADVVFAQFNTLQRDNEDVFVDTRNGSSYVSEELNAAKDLTWVFDDLVVGIIDNSIVAFTPRSS